MASVGEVVLSYHDVLIRRSDFDCLSSPSGWLNDIIISFWFEYLKQDLYKNKSNDLFIIYPELSQMLKSSLDELEIKCIIESTGVMDLLPKLKLILVPINDMSTESTSVGGSHWSLLAYLPQKKSAFHYDSHGTSNMSHANLIYNRLMCCFSQKPCKIISGDCIQQSNCFDCGIHLCANAEALCKLYLENCETHKTIIELASKDVIKNFRSRMVQVIHKLKNNS